MKYRAERVADFHRLIVQRSAFFRQLLCFIQIDTRHRSSRPCIIPGNNFNASSIFYEQLIYQAPLRRIDQFLKNRRSLPLPESWILPALTSALIANVAR